MLRTTGSTRTTFPVADVEPATKALAQVPYAVAVDRYLRPQQALADCMRQYIHDFEPMLRRSGFLDRERQELAMLRVPSPLQTCSRGADQLVAGIDHHPLMAALQLAYAQHRSLSLSPDMLWLLICQGVAHHINAHAERLRSRLVRHEGRLALTVRRDDFVPGSADNPWPEVFAAFSAQIRAHFGLTHERFAAEFSTTGPTEKAASEIVLLDALQRFVHLYLRTYVCGIPEITLEGTVDDWQAILDRVEAFADLDLEWWLTPLRPVLREFVAAARGEVDRTFWRSIYRIYHPDEPCSLDSATGWSTVFFPYLLDANGNATRRNDWLAGDRDLEALIAPEDEGPRKPRRRLKDPRAGHGLFEGQLPTGVSKAPFVWELRMPDGALLKSYEMELLGGFVGVREDTRTLCLRPEIGWAVRKVAPLQPPA
jgi:Domain of unknown function (DUF4419)